MSSEYPPGYLPRFTCEEYRGGCSLFTLQFNNEGTRWYVQVVLDSLKLEREAEPYQSLAWMAFTALRDLKKGKPRTR